MALAEAGEKGGREGRSAVGVVGREVGGAVVDEREAREEQQECRREADDGACATEGISWSSARTK